MSDSDMASNYYKVACHLMQIGEGCVWGMKSVFKAFENAADLGHTYAKVLLARLLSSKQESKTRAEQIAREVRSEVQECADGGDSEAQWCLGILYWMEKEISNAFFWLKGTLIRFIFLLSILLLFKSKNLINLIFFLTLSFFI